MKIKNNKRLLLWVVIAVAASVALILSATAGIAAYHEFADPYRVKVGMNGMAGAFTLYDENRSQNRGVIRAGFDYTYRDLSMYGSLISYIDGETRTSAKTGMKIGF